MDPKAVFDPNARVGATTLTLWDLKRGERIRSLDLNGDPVQHAALSPDGKRLVSVSVAGVAVHSVWGQHLPPPHLAVHLWDTANGKLVATLAKSCLGAGPIVFSPDGGFLVAALCTKPRSRPQLKKWTAENGADAGSFGALDSSPYAMAVSPCGKLVAMAQWDRATLVSAGSGKVEWVYRLPREIAARTQPWRARCIAFAPDGNSIVIAGPASDFNRAVPPSHDAGGIIRLCTAKGTPIHSFAGTRTWVHRVSYSPDGKHVFGATRDGLQFWHSDSGKAAFLLTN